MIEQFGAEGRSGASTGAAPLFENSVFIMLIPSVRQIDFVKDDVSCLDMPSGHSWSDRGIMAPSLLRRGGGG